MSAIERLDQLALPVKAERKPRRTRTRGLTARERVDLFGHLSHEEKVALRKQVDIALRAKHGLAADNRPEVRERCNASGGPFSLDNQCRNLARPGSVYCHIHLRMEAA